MPLIQPSGARTVRREPASVVSGDQAAIARPRSGAISARETGR